MEGNADVIWGLIDDIWHWQQNKISPYDTSKNTKSRVSKSCTKSDNCNSSNCSFGKRRCYNKVQTTKSRSSLITSTNKTTSQTRSKKSHAKCRLTPTTSSRAMKNKCTRQSTNKKSRCLTRSCQALETSSDAATTVSDVH